MSVVVFPFKSEIPEVVLGNLTVAANHDLVDTVLAIGVEEEETYAAIDAARDDIAAASGTRVELILQERIGSKRPGKGDGMNSALRWFLANSDAGRLHFYDSDITSFSGRWISKAEDAADLGYDVVRHYFPRASTDAMITWMVTRVGFALAFPRTVLPWIEQPLGGELMLKRPVVEALVASERVQAQSDWGIDTLYTFAAVAGNWGMFETYIPEGKAHKLYGRLTDLRTMLVECFAAVQSLRHEPVPLHVPHRTEYPDVVPSAIREKVGYTFESTMWLLPHGWTDRMEDLAQLFPTPIRDGIRANRRHPTFDFMDEDAWFDVMETMLDEFEVDDPDWGELLFKLWITRVLHYTTNIALRGYDYADRYLHGMVVRAIRRAALRA